MIVIPPVTITSAQLVSSTVPEGDSGTFGWQDDVTYAKGEFAFWFDTKVRYQSLVDNNLNNEPPYFPSLWSAIGVVEVPWMDDFNWTIGNYVYKNHRVYQSLQVDNLNHDPITSPEWWEDVGPTAQFAMFDTLRNTATVGASPLEVVLAPGEWIDTVAILGATADSVRVVVTNLGVTVYDETEELRTREVTDYYDYFFKPFIEKKAIIFQNIPMHVNAIVTVTFTRQSGNISVGAVVIGRAVDLGTTLANPTNDGLNFSTVDRALDGTAVLIPRRTLPKTSQTILGAASEVSTALALRDALNAVPAVWAGISDSDSDFFPPLLILGFYRKFAITLENPDRTRIALELEEV